MFVPMVPSNQRRRSVGGAVRSWTFALLGHGALCAAAVWGTLRPQPVSAAGGQPMVITWPQAEEDASAGGTTATDQIDAVQPPLPPVGLPPIAPLPIAPAGSASRDAASLPAGGPPVAAADEPWTVALVEEPPALLAASLPRYPDLLRAAGITGRVVMEVVIDTLGRAEPGSAVVVESANAGFDAAARQYVLGARFRPARVHGRAVRVLVRVPIDFTLTAW